MIQWVDEQCRTWGAHKRWLEYGSHGWPPLSILGKLMAEGPGAGHQSGGSRIPIGDDPPEYAAVCIALQKMAATRQMEIPWRVVHAHYLVGGKAKSKAPELRISLPQYWQQLHAGHAFIAACEPVRNVPRETEPYIQNVSGF